MKKKLSLLLIILVVVALTMSLTACSDEPEYVVPTGITVAYGSTLADIILPEGFSWQDDLTTSVGEVGDHTFLVT